MSYGLQIAGDAIADLRELDATIQEDVLDELEAVAAAPANLRADRRGYAIHDFDRVSAGTRHVVFVRVHRDDVRQMVTVLAVIDHPRSSPAT